MKKNILLSLFVILFARANAFNFDADYQWNDTILQPGHIVCRTINSSGAVVQEYPADFSYSGYYGEGKLHYLNYPNSHLGINFYYDNDHKDLTKVYTVYYLPEYDELYRITQEFTYENGLLYSEHHKGTEEYMGSYTHSIIDNNDTCFYDDDGRIIQRYREDSFGQPQACWIYEYQNNGKTKVVTQKFKWGGQGEWVVQDISTYRYDDDYALRELLTEYHDHTSGVSPYSIVITKKTYQYTEKTQPSSEITQTLVENEWVNSTIHNYLYDSEERIAEQQDGVWIDTLGDWNINRKTVHEYSDADLTYTVSFYKKNGEVWVPDYYRKQMLFFEPELKWQQKELEEYFSYVNQFEFTMVETPNPNNCSFESDGLHYTVISTNPSWVRLGGVDAIGEIVVPELVIHSSTYKVTQIDESSFNPMNLQALTILSPTPPELVGSPQQLPRSLPVYVPATSLEAYRNAPGWSDFSHIMPLPVWHEFEHGSEWYYEIQDESGKVTYQHLEYAQDTTINENKTKVVVRTNHIYDKDESVKVTHEYLYEKDSLVYWWNKSLQEFTVLYDFAAKTGDEWMIRVGTDSLLMHVDTVEFVEYEGNVYRTLRVSDDGGLFSGDIVCGIGHLTSFFPERLMAQAKGFQVEGIRCHWRDGLLVFKYGNRDCDEIYEQCHHGLEENGNEALWIYPNPTGGLITVETSRQGSQQEYRITNVLGQTLMSGIVNDQTLDVSSLPCGIYFLSINGHTVKLMKQ